MQFSDLLHGVDVIGAAGNESAEIRGVQYDSRRVCAGDVFVAMRGGSTDGNRFVDAALMKGAAALVTDSPETFGELRARQPELASALVDHGRRALAEASSVLFGRPQDKLKLSAVTGTNGKTTTAFLLEQMLASVGRKSVLLGTVETRVGDQVRPSEHTTPESRDILAVLAEGVCAGCTEAVMEMSSHALDQERVWGLAVDVAIFTNLTQDHLEYHGSMEAYARAKARLFTGTGAPPPRVAVINDGADYAGMMIDACARDSLVARYGLDSSAGADHWVEDLHLGLGDTRFRFVTPQGSIDMHSPLSGRVNVYNLLAASCAAVGRGLSLEQVAAATETLQQVPGRFQVVPGSREAGFTVVVDYAHTDDALANLMRLGRESVAEQGGKVITMFGCGGDRDRTKRPKMGRAAAAGSDFLVVTSDNPRSEEPMAIINEILVGVREQLGMFAGTFVVEEDRRAAIEVAIRSAKPGDIVLLAGKGHEKTQTFADGAVPFDDVAEAERVLRDMAAGVDA